MVRHYQELAFRAAYLITGNPSDAEDVIQEAFLKAHAALESFQPGRPFRPWLLRIVTNEARNRRRSATRQERLRLRLPDYGQAHGASPESEVIAAQQREVVMRELAELPELDRLTLTLHYFLDLSIAEIAQLFDCPPSTIRSRLLRARGRLRERLRQADSGPDEPHTEEGLLR
jgi:RNA polymerase sigma-70 factor (ECF subfamily)